MKRAIACAFVILFALVSAINVGAQTSESIWLTATTTAYKTGETVLVALNASSATPIRGFTFQIRYDPACLRPVNASSPIPGMNGLPLPQLTGLVDGSYASTAPQAVSGGILAEVRFSALKGCETNITLESAALAIRSADGFAAPLPGVSLGERNISLFIDKEVGASQASQPESGSILPLDPPQANSGIQVWWIIGILLALLAGLLIFVLGAYSLSRKGKSRKPARAKASHAARKAALHIKRGPHAGKSFPLTKLPFLIGSDPQSDIYINDPNVIERHAQIYAGNQGYCLMDLGSGTIINGRRVRGSSVILNPGDVVKLGKSALFVFG